MSDYTQIINNLTQTQILRLLADFRVITEEEYRDAGIPAVMIGRVSDTFGDGLPSPAAVVSSWDTTVMKQTAAAAVQKLRRGGVNLAVIPSPAVGISPLSARLSEDGLLSRATVGAYREALTAYSIPFVIGNNGLDPRDADWMGNAPDERTVYETLTAVSTDQNAEDAFCLGVTVSMGNECEAFRRVGLEASADLPGSVFCIDVRPGDSVKLLMKGCVLVGGNVSELASALSRYNEEKREIDAGRRAPDRLSQMITDGEALPDDVLRASLERVIGIAFRIRSLTETGMDPQMAAQPMLQADRIIPSASVLLRNRGLLPLVLPAPRKKRFPVGGGTDTPEASGTVAVIGSVILSDGPADTALTVFIEKLSALHAKDVTFCRGYDCSVCDGGDDLIREAYEAAKNADRVILCLGPTPVQESGMLRAGTRQLPANQLALAHELRALGDKIAAVVFSDLTFDTAFAAPFSALIKMPAPSPAVLCSAADILCGTAAPAGRLPVTMYADTDRIVSERHRAQSRYGLKTGPFTGYRAYPDTGIPVDDLQGTTGTSLFTEGFCFGHGLTYTKFRYSRMSIADGQVSFTVTNTGDRPGTAVPQLYIGMKQSRAIRPDRQLCGFLTVELQPKESRILTMPLQLPEVSDGTSGQLVTEQGDYVIMIGESAADIRLSKVYTSGEAVVSSDAEPISRYCVSESNILQEGYTLEAHYTMKKRTPKNLILGFILLALAAGVRFLFADLGVNSIAVSVIALVLFLCAAACFVFEIIDRSREEKRIVNEVNELNDRFFADADTVTVTNVSEVFVKEFDRVKAPVTKAVDTVRTDDEYRYIDRAYTLSDAADDLIRYAAAQGYQFTEDAARTVLAAMSSSRLLVPCGMGETDAAVLQELLCGFFGTAATASAPESLTDEAGLFITATPDGKAYSGLYNAVEAAGSKRQAITLHRLTDIPTDGSAACLLPFVRFAAGPRTADTVRFTGIDGAAHTLNIPVNFWLMLDPGRRYPVLPGQVSPLIAESAAFFTCAFRKCEPAASGEIRTLSFWQFRYLWENAQNGLDISEDMWKRTDELSAYAAQYGGFTMNNRIATGLEQYAATYRACGGDADASMDHAVAARLVPCVLRAVSGKLQAGDMTPDAAVESIFGEDTFPASVKAARLRRAGTDTEQV